MSNHNDDDYEYVSYKGPTTIAAETVYHFLRGSLYGAAFGLVTPFHPPGSPKALQEATTGKILPAKPFSSLRAVPSNAIMFGSLLAVQRFSCKSMEYARSTQDPWNDLFGCCVAVPYYTQLVVQRGVWHNRIVGGLVMAAIVYANG